MEVLPLRPRGVSLRRWEAYEKPLQKFNWKASTSTCPRQSLKQVNPNEKKKAHQEENL